MLVLVRRVLRLLNCGIVRIILCLWLNFFSFLLMKLLRLLVKDISVCGCV